MKKTFLLLSGIILFLSGFTQEKPPEIVNDTASVIVNDSVSVNVLLNDWCMEGHTMEILFVWAGEGGTVTFIDSTITFFPFYYFEGIDSITYIIKDLDNGLMSEYGYLTVVVDNPGQENLNVNNINALINSYALQFWSQHSGEHGIFEVPKGNGTHTVFNFDLWMGGFDENGELKLAAERYRQTGIDFWTGPVSNNYSNEDLILWNNLWKLNKTDIEYHKYHWMEPDYEPIENIRNWPAFGDINNGQLNFMAPFNDNDGDENYSAENGDYPVIRGDQSLFFVYNDDKEEHTESQGRKIGAEIHGQAYAFDCPDDSVFNNSIFFHYDIINRSDTVYHDFYLGAYVDFDLGNPWDDFVGCDTLLQSFFAYNGDEYDENSALWDPDTTFGYHNYPPAQGVVFLNTGMSSFLSYIGYLGPTGHPDEAGEYYNNLTGLWIDSTAITYGGNGYSGDTTLSFNYMYPGNPSNLEEWSEVSAESIPDDKNAIGATGPYVFNPGDTIKLDLAFVFARDYQGDYLSSVTLLKERIETLRYFFDNDSTPCGASWSSVPQKELQRQLVAIYPNPCKEFLEITFEKEMINEFDYFITDIYGRIIKNGFFKSKTNRINTSDMKSGIYILKSESNETVFNFKFMKY